MIGDLNLPEKKSGDLLYAAEVNAIIDALRYLLKLRGSGPVVVEGASGGPIIRIQGVPKLVRCKLTSIVAGRPGWYNAKLYIGSLNPANAGGLTEAEIGELTATEEAFVWYLPDVGASAHGYPASDTSAPVWGWAVGVDPQSAKPIVLITDAGKRGSTDNPLLLYTGTAENADAVAWDRAADNRAVWVPIVTRVVYNASGDEVEYFFWRYLKIDSFGTIYAISAETRAIVDAPVECTP